MVPRVRFDDLTPGSEASFELTGPGEIITATGPGEVRPALEQATELSRSGRWVAGYVSYDAAPGLDPGLAVPGGPARPPEAPPLVWFAAFSDRRTVEPFAPAGGASEGFSLTQWRPEVTRDEYLAAVAQIKDRIAAGDTYQVNHTFRLRAGFSGDPFAFYRELALAQRGAYLAFLDTGRHQIASASPELFFALKGSSIRVKPMKGTIGRGRWPEEDEALGRRLRASEKDRAENIMIVDLLRNDVGRIARFGSVTPRRLLDLERYETVWQLTSEVSAELVPGATTVDVFAALFPSGSVTGAPKKKTMEIISGLETSPRGVYCGAVGFLAPGGDGPSEAEFSVAIRTAVIDSRSGTAEYGIGGGITWDSVPLGEYEEAMLKAHVLEGPNRAEGLFETLRWEPGTGYWLLDRHLDRLAASAAHFGLACDRAAAEAVLKRVAEDAAGPRLVRLMLDRSGGLRASLGERLPPVGEVESGGPLRVAVSEEPVASGDVMLFHKTTRREPYDRRARARPDVDDVLLVNERNEVTESTKSNVAVRIDGSWFTPPIASGCLPGTLRAELLATGELTERPIEVAELHEAGALALLNSVRGWRAAELVD